VLIVADKQILCATCGALIGLVRQPGGAIPIATLLKDQYVVFLTADRAYCNIKCKERAQV
jgi:hypothetical protein